MDGNDFFLWCVCVLGCCFFGLLGAVKALGACVVGGIYDISIAVSFWVVGGKGKGSFH